MKLTKWTLFVLSLLLTVQLYGQDSVSVYFEFGHSKLPDGQLNTLNSLATQYELSDLDSVHFIGMADSVGNLKSNLKLSEKRAKSVAKHCQGIFPRNIPVKITALGERVDKKEESNRKVNLILYFNSNEIEEEIGGAEDLIIDKEVCYTVDYHLLHRSHLRTIKKRKKELILIESKLLDLKKKEEQYYGSTNAKGEFVAKKVKWSFKRTGKLWWAKQRSIANILKEDFEKYKIFKIEDLPCNSCHEDFQKTATLSKEDSCIQVDRFLMENIQFKPLFFNKKKVSIRAPREFVLLEDRYYMGCGFHNKLLWETKKAKRKRSYYYSKLTRNYNAISNITRVMDCCKNDPEPSACDKSIIQCASLGVPDSSFVLNAEIGSHHQQSTLTPYFGIGISKEGWFNRFSLFAGTDLDLRFQAALRYQFHFLSFPFNAINPTAKWQSASQQLYIQRYARMYLGTEVKTRMNKPVDDYLEQNIHIGLAAVNTSRDAFIPRIFVQYGLAADYLRNVSEDVYPLLQVGLNVKLARIKNK